MLCEVSWVGFRAFNPTLDIQHTPVRLSFNTVGEADASMVSGNPFPQEVLRTLPSKRALYTWTRPRLRQWKAVK